MTNKLYTYTLKLFGRNLDASVEISVHRSFVKYSTNSMEFHSKQKINKTHFKVRLNTFWPLMTTFDYFWTTQPWCISLEDDLDGSDQYDHDGCHLKPKLMVLTYTTMIDFIRRRIWSFRHMTIMDFTRRRIWWFWPIWPWWISLEDQFDDSDPFDHRGFHSK